MTICKYSTQCTNQHTCLETTSPYRISSETYLSIHNIFWLNKFTIRKRLCWDPQGNHFLARLAASRLETALTTNPGRKVLKSLVLISYFLAVVVLCSLNVWRYTRIQKEEDTDDVCFYSARSSKWERYFDGHLTIPITPFIHYSGTLHSPPHKQ